MPEANPSIKAELGYDGLEIAGIGPAGENLVAFANIQVSEHRVRSRPWQKNGRGVWRS